MIITIRTASFIGAFGDGDVRAANIRYFFPEGCQAPRIEIDAVVGTDAKKKFSNEIDGKKTNTPITTAKNDKVPSQQNVLNNAADEKKKNPRETANNGQAIGGGGVGYQYGKQSSSLPSENGSCCDALKPQILFPRANSDCGSKSAKIVIPIDLSAIEKIPMKEITELTTEKVSIEMIRKLLKLAEKYQI